MNMVTLSSLISALESGRRPVGGIRDGGGEIFSLGAEHLDGQGGFDFSNIKRISREFYNSMSSGRVSRNDILLVKDGATTAKVSFVADDFPFAEAAVNEHVFRLRVSTELACPKYIFHYLRSPIGKAAILRDFRGATVGGISRGFVSRIRLPLPPLAEQRRIAAILDKAEAIRRKREESIRLADKLLASAFLEMFGDPVSNTKGWPVQRLGTLADIRSGVTKGRKIDPTGAIAVPYLRVANVQDGYLNLHDVQKIEVLPSELDRYLLQKGDVLLTEGGDPDKLGRGAVWQGEILPCIHQNHIFRVRPDQTVLLPSFLSAQLGSARGKRYFLRAAKQTTGIASINMTQLHDFGVMLPPRAIQQSYERITEGYGVLRARLQGCSLESRVLLSSLARSAFRGESALGGLQIA